MNRVYFVIYFVLSLNVFSVPVFADYSAEELLEILKNPENTDVLAFVQGFAQRLREFNPDRLTHNLPRDERRMDAIARLLEGDEVCGAAAFDGSNTIIVATNHDGHFHSAKSPLWHRLYVLRQYLILISNSPNGSSVDREMLSAARADVLMATLPHLVVRRDAALSSLTDVELEPIRANANILRTLLFERASSGNAVKGKEQNARLKEINRQIARLKATKNVEKVKNYDEEIEKLTTDSLVLAEDFALFVSSPQIVQSGSDSDVVQAWAEHYLARKDATVQKSHVTKAVRVLQDMLKLERYFSHEDFLEDPDAKALRAAAKSHRLLFHIVDDGGRGTHAEIRVLGYFLKVLRPCPYVGISKLCCPYCSVVLQSFSKDSICLSRGGHAEPFPWPFHDGLAGNKDFLNALLGPKLREKLGTFGERKSLLMDVLEFFPKLRYEPYVTQAQALGIEFPRAYSESAAAHSMLAADPSVAYSQTPVADYVRFAIQVFKSLESRRMTVGFIVEADLDLVPAEMRQSFREGLERDFLRRQKNSPPQDLLVQDSDPLFSHYQELLASGDIWGRIIEVRDDGIDLGLWYGDEHMHGILQRMLPIDEGFFVLAPGATVLSNPLLVRQALSNAVQQAVAGATAVAPLHVRGNHWAGAAMTFTPGYGLSVIFNDPLGYYADLEPTMEHFYVAIRHALQEFAPGAAYHFIDLHVRRQDNPNDCGPFVAHDLVELARYLRAHRPTDRAQVIQDNPFLLFNDNGAKRIRADHRVHFEALGLRVPEPEDENFEDFSNDAEAMAPSPYLAVPATALLATVIAVRKLSH